MVSNVTCMDCECRELNEVMRGLDSEGNMTDVTEREKLMKEDKQGL